MKMKLKNKTQHFSKQAHEDTNKPLNKKTIKIKNKMDKNSIKIKLELIFL